MKHLPRAIFSSLLALALLHTAPPASAQEADDVENATTPTSLTGLLPEGGIDAVDIDFWLIMDLPEDASGMYIHWSIQPEDGKLVVTMQQGSGDADGFSNTRRLVYTAEGKLESFTASTSFGGFGGSETAGKVVGDALVITETQINNDPGFKPEPEMRKVPLAQVEAAAPPEWMPLIFAYHIRAGNLGYTFAMNDVVSRTDNGTLTVEDLGEETVDHEGGKATAHLLLVKIKEGDGSEQTIKMLVLDNGELMKMSAEAEGMQMNATRATAEEVAEKFGLNADNEAADEQAQPDDAAE